MADLISSVNSSAGYSVGETDLNAGKNNKQDQDIQHSLDLAAAFRLGSENGWYGEVGIKFQGMAGDGAPVSYYSEDVSATNDMDPNVDDASQTNNKIFDRNNLNHVAIHPVRIGGGYRLGRFGFGALFSPMINSFSSNKGNDDKNGGARAVVKHDQSVVTDGQDDIASIKKAGVLSSVFGSAEIYADIYVPNTPAAVRVSGQFSRGNVETINPDEIPNPIHGATDNRIGISLVGFLGQDGSSDKSAREAASTARTAAVGAFDEVAAQAIANDNLAAFMDEFGAALADQGIINVSIHAHQVDELSEHKYPQLTDEWDGSGTAIEGWEYVIHFDLAADDDSGIAREFAFDSVDGKQFGSFNELKDFKLAQE